jgi:hypothetical protein
MEKYMKLLALILAFACYADAQAYEVTDSGGTWHLDQSGAFTQDGLTVGTWYVRGPNMFAVTAIRGCAQGQGNMVLTMNGKSKMFPWNSKDMDTIDRVGLLTCVTAFTKGQK